jgi:general L-amino acid transport system permease protein
MADAMSFHAVAARPAPVYRRGPAWWLRHNLFAGPFNSLATLALGLLVVWALWHIAAWGIVNAEWQPDFQLCRALDHHGACWGVIVEKFRLIFFGRFPYEEQWRPLVATLLMLGLVVFSCYPGAWNKGLILIWIANLVILFFLMHGNVLGLTVVETARWGGFPLTLLLATAGIAAAFPLAILVALGRRSHMPGFRAICVVYVELIRGVPLISVLFMASALFPLLMPPGLSIDVLLRVLVGITLFSAAYLAEVVRAGLQAVPVAQLEAAAALGLSYWQTQRKIMLPQALRKVVPALVNSFIGTFKDTSLVTIVSLYELTGALRLALTDPDWRPYFIEGYLFIALIYFVCCFAMSRYSQWIERRLSAATLHT